MKDKSIDILALHETRLNDTIKASDNYRSRQGRGVARYIL
jgi:hypothetical protein